ncbi:MAG: hypothetical protein V3W04_09145 [Gammaproteobacteria bacterium]
MVYLHGKSYSEAQAMVDIALELEPEMKNALKLQEYVVSKMDRLEEMKTTSPKASAAAMPQDEMHGDK